MIKHLSELREIVKKSPKKKLVVAAAHDEHSLEAVVNAAKMKIIDPILVGDKEKMHRIGDKLELDLSRRLFAIEDNLKPVSVMMWYQLIEWIGDLADYAEKTGDRLRLLIAR